MSAKDHWSCDVVRHPGYRTGEHGKLTDCGVADGHNPNVGPRDCYTCKQAATRRYRGETRQRADKEHFACALMPWEHDPPNQIGSVGGHRDGCAVLLGHSGTPGKRCPQCRRRYAGLDGLSPAEFENHPHYDCPIPVWDHPIKPRVGRGHRPGCRVAAGHDEGGVSQCERCTIAREGENYGRNRALKTAYGLTEKDYDSMLSKQGGVCAICGRMPTEGHPLHVDHDHASGAIRGLLCKQCNTGLGNFQDQIALLSRASDYLRGL